MDKYPSQTSKVGKHALEEIEAEMHVIAPDLNPIENIFHLIKTVLQHEAISCNIFTKLFEQFQTRVLTAFDSFSADIIDCTIDSMPERIQAELLNQTFNN